MILRKPYAFLIKNFKKIHLFILFFIVLLTYNIHKYYKFFNEYVKDRRIEKLFEINSKYINKSSYFYIAFVLIFVTIILVLIWKKKKPNALYWTTILFYIVYFILLMFNIAYYDKIIQIGIDPRISRVLRDFNFIAFFSSFFFIILYSIRTVGFDIKKFNFGEDILEFQIDVSDNEEFELTKGINLDSLSRKTRNNLRERHYFFIENKAIIVSLIIILVVTGSSFFIYNYKIVNKVYQKNEIVNYNDVLFSVEESYITKLGYDSNVVLKNEDSFIIIKMKVQNKSSTSFKFVTDNFYLLNNEKVILFEKTYNRYFIDFGNIYNGETIAPGNEMEFVILYRVDNVNSNLFLTYFHKANDNKKYKIKIKPINLDKINNIEIFKNEKVVFLNSNIFIMKSANFDNLFEYEYLNKKYKVTLENAILLELQYDLNMDLSFVKDNGDFFSKYLTIEGDGKKFAYRKVDVLEKNNNRSFFSVSKSLMESNEIYLCLNFRNNKYKMKVK